MSNFAKENTVKAGNLLIVDGGFDCLRCGAVKLVLSCDTGLYIRCDEGEHFISGQLDDGEYIGLSHFVDRRKTARRPHHERRKDTP